MRHALPLAALLFVVSVSAQTVQTTTAALTTGWNPYQCQGWQAEPAYGGSITTVEIGRLDDIVPAGALVRSISVTWRLGNGRQYSYLGVPAVSLAVNGTQIGQTYAVTNLSLCDEETTMPYVFDSGDFPSGFSAWLPSGPNILTLTLAGGSVFPSAYPVVTIQYVPPDSVTFNVTDAAPEPDRRILISNADLAYPYPHFQALGAVDGMVPMSLRTRNAQGQPAAGMTVYVRVTDPPDTAPYTNLPGNPLARIDDNTGVLPHLEGPALSTLATNSKVYTGTSGANGLLEFKLVLQTPVSAGDNYQVEASYVPTFPSGATWKSGTLTAWKRIFVEKRRMLKNGLFISDTAHAGDTQLYIRRNAYGGNDGKNKLSKGERIVLVHAPQLNGSNTQWYMEEHTILSVEDLGADDEYLVKLGTKQGKTVNAEALLHDYGFDFAAPSIGDGIAHLSGSTLSTADYYDVETGLALNSVFPAANVEYILRPDTSPADQVPMAYVETSNQAVLQAMADKWSRVVATPSSGVHRALPNHQLLIIAGSSGDPGQAGVTVSKVTGERSSWVFRRTIENFAKGKGANIAAWCEKTATHELAHQWLTNLVFDPFDHCGTDSKVFDDPGLYCLLASYDPAKSETQRDNGVARFHLVPNPSPGAGPFGAWHSEYFGIRNRPDPFVP